MEIKFAKTSLSNSDTHPEKDIPMFQISYMQNWSIIYMKTFWLKHWLLLLREREHSEGSLQSEEKGTWRTGCYSPIWYRIHELPSITVVRPACGFLRHHVDLCKQSPLSSVAICIHSVPEPTKIAKALELQMWDEKVEFATITCYLLSDNQELTAGFHQNCFHLWGLKM